MLLAASVCPHPPLLLPAVTSGGVDVLADLRAVCLRSLRHLTSAGVRRWVAVGAASEPGEWDGDAGGSLDRFGVPAAYGGPRRGLPLSLTVAAYLLDAVGWTGERHYVAVTEAAGNAVARQRGADLAEADDVALLAMADGSARRSPAAPGYLDDRAEPFDAAVRDAVARADAEALAGLPSDTARAVWAGGLPVWWLLGGVAAAAYRAGAEIQASVRYDAAPLGVGYLVADWAVTAPPPSGTQSGRPARSACDVR